MIQEMAYSCPRVGEVLPRAVMNVSTQAKEPSVPNLRMVRGVCRAMRLDGKQRVVLVLAAVLVLISGTQLDETASAVGYWGMSTTQDRAITLYPTGGCNTL